MANSLYMISQNAAGQTVTKTISNVNPAATDAHLAQFAKAFAALSDDTLKNVQKGVSSSLALPDSIDGTDDAETINSFFYGTTINAMGGNDTIVLQGAISNPVNTGSGSNTVSLFGGSNNNTITCAGSNDSVYLAQSNNNSIIASSLGSAVYFYSKSKNNCFIANSKADTVYLVPDNANSYLNYVENFDLYNDIIVVPDGASVTDSVSGDLTYITAEKDGNTAKIALKNVQNGTAYQTAINGFPINLRYGDIDRIHIIGRNETAKNISNSQSSITVYGSQWDDTISNTGNSVVIFGRQGNNSITNSGNNVMIGVEKGTSTIRLQNSAACTVYGGAGDNIIYGDGDGHIFQIPSGSNNTIFGFTANDSLVEMGGNYTLDGYLDTPATLAPVTITSTSAAESIRITNENGVKVYNNGEVMTVASGSFPVAANLGSGNDTITVSAAVPGFSIRAARGEDVTSIESGAGGNTYVYHTGDGKDSIYGWHYADADDADILKIITAYSSTSMSPGSKDFNIKVGSYWRTFKDVTWNKAIKIDNAGTPAVLRVPPLIEGSSTADTISNTISVADNPVVIDGGIGNDSISNTANYVSICGGAGNDSISNTANYVSISGGSGNDSISNTANYVSICGGSSNDTISNSGDYVTIYGGSGNDSISNSGHHIVYQFATGESQNTITGFNSTDSIQILAEGATVSCGVSGGNPAVIIAKDSYTATAVILEGYTGDIILVDADGNTIEAG